MPINKNALIRYKYLDKLLSDRHHYYTIRDLTEKVNEMMEKDGLDVHVVKRTIEKDLLALQCAPFSAPIDTIKKDGRNIVRYSKDSFSIFNEELSIEERHLLHEVLNTLGQFCNVKSTVVLSGTAPANVLVANLYFCSTVCGFFDVLI